MFTLSIIEILGRNKMLLAKTLTFLHVLATVAWVGGMIYTIFILTPAAKELEPEQQGKLMNGIIKKFSILAWTSIIVIFVTGIMKIIPGIEAQYLPISIVAKIVLAISMVLIGIYISFVLGPRLEKTGPSAEGLIIKKKINHLATLNLILGVIIIFISAGFSW